MSKNHVKKHQECQVYRIMDFEKCANKVTEQEEDALNKIHEHTRNCFFCATSGETLLGIDIEPVLFIIFSSCIACSE